MISDTWPTQPKHLSIFLMKKNWMKIFPIVCCVWGATTKGMKQNNPIHLNNEVIMLGSWTVRSCAYLLVSIEDNTISFLKYSAEDSETIRLISDV